MEHISELIRARRSVRTFDGRTVGAEDVDKLRAFMAEIENPYGIPVTFQLLDARKHDLTSPVVSGTDLYVAGKLAHVSHMEEAFGYSFETLVLYAQSLGIGTVWLGGTMNRSAFEKAVELEAGEKMPCASPLGYAAAKMSLRESMMRKGIKADSRLPFETLFFDGAFDKPLTAQAAGALAEPLELVRWAPSAVNRQPWRVVAAGDAAHFYCKHSKGFTDGPAGDMQKIDLGIALCHFALAAKEAGLDARFIIRDPGLEMADGLEYIASYHITMQ